MDVRNTSIRSESDATYCCSHLDKLVRYFFRNKMKEIIEEAIKILSDVRDNIDEFEQNAPSLLRIAGYATLIIDVECMCDPYNGFECGCTRRTMLIRKTQKEIRRRKKI